jgi:hypothetical protein
MIALCKRGHYQLNKIPFAGGTLDLIFSYLQIELIIGDGMVAVRTPIRKLINYLLF